MSDQKANVPSYIKRLNFFKAQLDYIVPPYIQREVADILQWYVDALEAKDKRIEELEAALREIVESEQDNVRGGGAYRVKIAKQALGEKE